MLIYFIVLPKKKINRECCSLVVHWGAVTASCLQINMAGEWKYFGYTVLTGETCCQKGPRQPHPNI